MKKIYLILLIVFAFLSGSQAQVTVSGSTGADGTYASLTQATGAFAAINAAGSQAGNNILITITADVATEDGANQLNNGGWTTLTINPSGTRTLSGNVNTSMIRLSGAANVTIDGLNSGGNSLAISNTNIGASAATITFANGASSNTIQNCNILGSATNLGVIFFTTGTVTGNNNNLITQCNISASAGGNPTNAILSVGTSAVMPNSNNTITVCNISDYFSAGSASTGININSNNSDWTITNNALYQTATRTYTTANTHNGILINSGAGYTINNNVIGFAAPNGTGTTNMIGYASGVFPGSGTFPTSYTPGGVANATRFVGINCFFAAGGAVSSIQNNTIGGIALYTSSGASTTFGLICGIAVTSGNANIGTVTGNTIGAVSGGSSIYAASTTAGGVISGIYCTTTNTINIQNNNIGGIDVSGTTATQAQGFKGIDAAGTGTYTITNNSVGNASANNIRTGYLLTAGSLSNAATTPTTATGTSAFTGILNSSTGSNINITNNTLQGFLMSGSVTTFTGIINTAAVTGNINIQNNNVGSAAAGLLTIAFANSGAIACISNTGGGAAATLNITGNTVRGMTYNANCTGAFQCISATATIGTENISNNNFTNLTVNTSNATQGFLIGASNGTTNVTVSGNAVVTQFTNTNAGGANYFAIANLSAVPTSGSSAISNNILSNITVRTTTSYAAMIYWAPGTGVACTHNISVTGNTLYNNANASLGTATQAASLFGIVTSSGSTNLIANNDVSFLSAAGGGVTGIIPIGNSTNTTIGNTTVRDNIVHDLKTTSVYSGSAAGSATGIQIQSGPVNNFVYKNKIYNILSVTPSAGTGGTVTGLVIVQATATSVNNVYNNIIGQLYATNSTFFQSVRGINIANSVANTTNVYYNTVYLDGTPGNQSYCLYMSNNAANSNLRNNIFINNAVSATNPQFTIFRNGASSLGTYSTASNNNILYCGTPGSLNLIYADGAVNALTNQQQTLAAFQAFVGPTRENASRTESSPFINTTMPATNSYLHINPTIATQAESGAVNIATYTDDYDTDIRQGNPGYPGTSTGTAPDIGADEFDVTVDHYGPEISYTAISSTTCGATTRTFTATVTDYSGVNVTAGTLPRVYYKKLTNANVLGGTNTNTTDGWKYTEATFLGGSSFSFTIDYTLVFGGVAAGDNIQYFVTAQDLFTPVNVGINSGSFAANPASVSLTGAAFPLGGTINSYNIVLPIPTLVTIGAAGTYPSLTGAGGLFADLNTKGLSGNTVVNIIDLTVNETGANSLNQMVYGCAGPNTLTIKPNAAGTTLTGSLASAALLKIKSSNVIIDGSSNGTSSQDLTITNLSVTAPSVVLIGSTVTTAVTNTTLKNCFVINGVNTATAVVVGDGTTLGTAGYFNNINLQNNNIQRAYNGIFAVAVPFAGNGSGLNITGNAINTSGANAIRLVGVYVQGVDGATVSGNDIGNFETISGEVDRGIWFATSTTNSVIEKNNIHDLQYTGVGGYGAKGISVSTGLAAANITIKNNMISGITGDGDSYASFGALYCPVGIYAFGAGQGGINIYYNSIYLTGSTLNVAATYSIGIALDNNTSANIKNNIIKNELGLLGGIGVGAVGIAAQTSAAQFTSLDHNDYYSLAVLGTNLIGKIGATDYATLAAWQTATTQEANSLNENPVFVSATDLHLVTTLNCTLDGYGTPIAGITNDYDNDTRDVAAPDMGADEFTAVYANLPAGIVGSAVCANKTVSPLGTMYGTGSCQIIARVLPSGGAAVNGKINACVTLDATVQSFNGEPYVQRHFDIEPNNTPATATATITLFFTDAEFVQYNTSAPVWPDMPTFAGGGNADPAIANVRITQFHGTPTGGLPTTTPGNYTGTRVLIIPTSVTYNLGVWSVTFPVTGFSGFYAHTTLTNAPLPVVVNYLTGRKQGSNHLLNWKVTCTTSPRATMTLERSADSRNFSGINTITADAARCNQPFDYTDANPLTGMNYYRLKIVDADGKVTYSTTVALLNAVKGFDIISIAPNPVVTDHFKLNVASAQSSKMDITIVDMHGRLVNRQTVSLIAGFNSLNMNVSNLASGTYIIQAGIADERSKQLRFVKQ
ncbi:MAG: right-handed parallel beta-helix repeat-containing protein [Chitinophagaceae bacterium]|nr:right-handed parallel beta-helix repeat-containing protein [Chitinophagaceae bacterium]